MTRVPQVETGCKTGWLRSRRPPRMSLVRASERARACVCLRSHACLSLQTRTDMYFVYACTDNAHVYEHRLYTSMAEHDVAANENSKVAVLGDLRSTTVRAISYQLALITNLLICASSIFLLSMAFAARQVYAPMRCPARHAPTCPMPWATSCMLSFVDIPCERACMRASVRAHTRAHTSTPKVTGRSLQAVGHYILDRQDGRIATVA